MTSKLSKQTNKVNLYYQNTLKKNRLTSPIHPYATSSEQLTSCHISFNVMLAKAECCTQKPPISKGSKTNFSSFITFFSTSCFHISFTLQKKPNPAHSDSESLAWRSHQNLANNFDNESWSEQVGPRTREGSKFNWYQLVFDRSNNVFSKIFKVAKKHLVIKLLNLQRRSSSEKCPCTSRTLLCRQV